jgi:hypothetical protein
MEIRVPNQDTLVSHNKKPNKSLGLTSEYPTLRGSSPRESTVIEYETHLAVVHDL